MDEWLVVGGWWLANARTRLCQPLATSLLATFPNVPDRGARQALWCCPAPWPVASGDLSQSASLVTHARQVSLQCGSGRISSTNVDPSWISRELEPLPTGSLLGGPRASRDARAFEDGILGRIDRAVVGGHLS